MYKVRKREGKIVPFDIKKISSAITKAFEAENTFIATGAVLAHEFIFKGNPKVIVILLVHLQKPFLTIRFSDKHLQIFILYQALVIKHILPFSFNNSSLFSRKQIKISNLPVALTKLFFI